MMILQALNDAGHTVVLVTHETTTANHAKRMLYMKDGRIIADDLIRTRRIAKDEKDLAK
jgi:ABC-type lipoprotein export system ATPase subunit